MYRAAEDGQCVAVPTHMACDVGMYRASEDSECVACEKCDFEFGTQDPGHTQSGHRA